MEFDVTLLATCLLTVEVPPVPLPQIAVIALVVYRLYFRKSFLEVLIILRGLKPPEFGLGPIEIVTLLFKVQYTAMVPVDVAAMEAKGS